MDYSWNHTGIRFWAFLDVKARGAASPYADWHYIESFDDPGTPEDEFAFQGWMGLDSLPEFREVIEGSHPKPGAPDFRLQKLEGHFYSEAVKEHIFHVSRRWLDPNGDGDPSDGIDGFRLDVAAEVPMGFWRDYRRFVRDINPEAYLVGEI